ncbi:ROK family transcriptional regulator [Candidatus Poriferisocius sp.]|uniref:ROK family transcriptional regulator n=1 Tax=Candidatus Poriferisocius sp. TaxID=3101276 RepID=UPI003B51B63F
MFDAAPQGISRADISRVTGLSKPTVSNLVADLEQSGLIRLSATPTTSGNVGRPAALYEFVPEAGFVVAADVGASKIIVGVANLLGTVIAEQELETGPNAETALNRVAETARQMLSEIGGQAGSACVGVPGIYRPHSDSVEQALNLPGFEGLRVRARLEELLDMEVHVDNDVNLAALAEADLDIDQTNFAAISIGTGIGMGIIVGGELYRGGIGAAGEVGSLVLHDSPADSNSSFILEDVSSAPAIRKQFGQAAESGHPTELHGSADVPEIFDAAAQGDPAAVHVLENAASAMATAVMQLCLIIDPERIVFGGGVGANQVFVEAVNADLHRRHSQPVEISASTLGRRATFLGAVSWALDELHESLVTDTLGSQR